MSVSAEEESLAREVLAALSDGDTNRFGELAADEIEIHTARGVREGHAEAVAWAANKYDHLQRRYAIDELHAEAGGGVIVRGRTEYVWKDGGGVADSSPVGIGLRFAGGKLVLWRFLDDPA
ncbi:MAG TPA: nuclear transport factor 2 family protein [Solirubrobacterales bacterium]